LTFPISKLEYYCIHDTKDIEFGQLSNLKKKEPKMTKSKIPQKAGKLLILVILLLVSIPVFAKTTQTTPDSIPFAPPVYYEAGICPSDVFCGDLDGDGDKDLAVADSWDDSVFILKNNGDGTFQTAVSYYTRQHTGSVFCSDLDGDGDLDLAVTTTVDSVLIFKNNGYGTFQYAAGYAVGWYPTDVFCGDLDGDLDSDLVVTTSSSNRVYIFKNNGDGSFVNVGNYGAGSGIQGVFCADLDGDSDLDIVTANRVSNNVSILKNNGDGNFQSAVNYAVGTTPYSVFSADLDSDADLDLAVANLGSDNVSIRKNNGDGTFQTAVNYWTGDGAYSVFCADLDLDLDLDLAVGNYYDGGVSILKNNGDGTFQSAVAYAKGDTASSVFCADLDGDGDLDLAVANGLGNHVSILKNLSHETANQPPIAFIDSIGPNPAEQEETVMFGGHGEDSDGHIVGYNWRSSIDGQLSDQASFTMYNLSAGPHMIYFKVQDEDGTWSPEVSEQLYITPGDGIKVTWVYGEMAFLREPYNIWLKAQNLKSYPIEFVYGLHEPWSNDLPNLQSSARVLGSLYTWATGISDEIEPGMTNTYTFEQIQHHWDWIEPWGITRAITLLFRFLPGVGSLAPQWQAFQNEVSVLREGGDLWRFINAVHTLQDVLGMKVEGQITFEGVLNSHEGTPFSIYGVVPQGKIALLEISVVAGFGAVLVTLVPSPWNWVFEIALTLGSERTYKAAYDPDSNYTELVSPEFIYPPQLDSIEDSEARAMSYEGFRAVAYLQALKSSYAKYLGALYDRNEQWSAIQLSAVQLYSHLAVGCLEPITDFLDSSIVVPTQAQIDSMRNYFATNGLPEYEQSVLLQFGYSQEEIDSVGAYFATVPDEYYYATDSIPSFLKKAVNDLDSLPRDFGEIPGGATLAVLGTAPETLCVDNPPAILNCWVEFPGDSDITGYQIISAVLNDTIQASYISPTPGDYDNDGVPDIAMQFNPAMLIPMLQPGQRLLSVSGDIVLPSPDTVLYSGSAIVTILEFIRGDANGDGVIDISDVVYLINYLFIHGPAPVPLAAGDATCDGVVDVSDVVYLINYLFVSGPAPGC
jgi:hypothetical protein